MNRWFFYLFLALAVTGCNSGGSSAPPGDGSTSPSRSVSGISLSQSSLILDAGQAATLAASVNYSDGSTEPVPVGSIAWSSSNTLVAAVTTEMNGDGQVTGNSVGQATITTAFQGHEATATVTVNAVFTRTDVLPGEAWIPPEFSGLFRAVARYTGGPDEDVSEAATWSILDPNVGAVSNAVGSKGLFYALAPGTTQLTASYNASTGSSTVHVMPIRLIGYGGAMYPTPNDLVSGPVVTIDGQNRTTASWGYASGEVFVGGHDGNNWTDRVQVNVGQSPMGLVHQHKIASNSLGARVVVWTGNTGLYAVHAPSGQQFGAVETLPTNLANFASDFRMIDAVGINSVGEAVIVWSGGGTTYRSTYNPVTTSWSQPEVLVAASVLKAAINPSGDIAFAWQTEDPTTHEMTAHVNIFVADSGPGSGLQTPSTLYFSPWPGITELDIRINENRDAVVAWVAGYGLPNRYVYKAHYSVQSGWHGIGQVVMGDSGGALSTKLAINGANEVFLAWPDIGGDRIYATRYTPAGGWSSAQAISDLFGLGTAQVDAIAISSAGNAICIFRDGESGALLAYKYRRYTVGNGWGPTATLLHTGRVGDAWATLMADYNSAGRGAVVWRELNTVPFNGGLTVVKFNFMELAPNINP